MKIIDIGVCVDNLDPKGIGRIRCVRYSDYVGEKEKAVTYEKWDDKDMFIAIPFLPPNINFIPEIGQAVKIINYNSDKDHVNQEYIAGPFTTMFDFNSQTFSQQVENTSYGVQFKNTPDIYNKETGKFIEDKSEGVFAKEKDFAIYGKSGSDIVFTENGLQLRGGKLLSKQAASGTNRKKMLVYPLMTQKSSSIYLKKFPKKLVKTQKLTKKEIIEVQPLKYVIEFEIDSLSSPSNINFFVYKVVKSIGKTYQSDFFNENTPLSYANIKLINTDGTSSTPTFTVPITDINQVTTQIRTIIFSLHEDYLIETIRKQNITNLDYTSYPNEDIHPFYFRPTQQMKNYIPTNTTQEEIKDKIFNFKLVTGIGPGSGLVWQSTQMKNKPKLIDVIVDELKEQFDSPEQTFATVKSDKIYFLSTDTNDIQRIKFEEFDKYELTQDDYVQKIEDFTFASVRGEKLVEFLEALYNAFLGHKHNINKVYTTNGFDEHQVLKQKFETLKNDILNNSIRIN
jgi:hypothetical protein